MAEVVDDTSESTAVPPRINLPPVSSVTTVLGEDHEVNSEDHSESVTIEDSVKKVHFESVDLEEDGDDDEDGDDEDDDDGNNENVHKKKRLKKKKPKHILIEDDSSSDDDVDQTATIVNPSDLTWLMWMWYYIAAVSSGALKAAEYLGEKLAAFFGITTPKYQYVIDEYYRLKELEREEEEKEQREKELIANRKMEDLARLEDGSGGTNVELNKQLPQ